MATNDITGAKLITKVQSKAFDEGHDRIFGKKEKVTISLDRAEFEDWYGNIKRYQHAVWHEDEQRYTVFSTKEYAWQVWKASRGI